MPTTTTTYTATATGPGGTVTAMATVTVTQPVPTVTLSAAPASILAGQKSTLSWSSQNATSLSIDNGVGKVTVPAGTMDVTPSATTTYTITATGAGGSANATATVTVQQQLGVTLAAKPASIAAGQSSTLTWTSQAASSVDIQPGIGTVDLNGSVSVTPSATTTYTATAHDASGNTKTATATVTIVPGGSLQSSIKHIIFFVQENRSFDSYFGKLGQYKASLGLANDVDGLPSNAVQLDKNGTAVHPYHYQTTCVENTSPSWNPSWDVWNGGKMDRFVERHGAAVDHRSQLPPRDGLLRPDATSVLVRTGGAVRDQRPLLRVGDGGHDSRTACTCSRDVVRAHLSRSAALGGFTQKTIFRLMTDHGVNWRYYYQDNSIFLGQFSDWNDPAISGRVVQHRRLVQDRWPTRTPTTCCRR